MSCNSVFVFIFDFWSPNSYSIYISIRIKLYIYVAPSTGLMIASFAVYGMAFAMASFTLLPTAERANGAKHQQYLAGAGPMVYWLANASADFLVYTYIYMVWGCLWPCDNGSRSLSVHPLYTWYIYIYIGFTLSLCSYLIRLSYILCIPWAYSATWYRLYWWVLLLECPEYLRLRKMGVWLLSLCCWFSTFSP